MWEEHERKGIEKKFYDLALEVLSECGFDLYDLNYVSSTKTLKIYIYRTDTHSAELDDCVKVDQAFGPHFETLEWIPSEITLEVSSPGIFRELKSRKHFELALGQPLSLNLTLPLKKVTSVESLPQKISKLKKVEGILKEIHGETVMLELAQGGPVSIPKEQIKKASLNPQI